METLLKSRLGRWLWAAFEGLLAVFFLWSALGDRLQRFVASGGREEGPFLATLLGVAALGLAALLALAEIGRRLTGRAAAVATTGVLSVLWLAFVGGVLLSAGVQGAWLTVAALMLGPLLVAWVGVGMHLRTLRTPVSADQPAAPLGVRRIGVVVVSLLVASAGLGPAIVSLAQGGWRESGPVLVALFVGLVLLMAVLAWFFGSRSSRSA
ncbi:hypothetical protein DMC25_04750 [Caulobacter sp. D4A]|uniref:hypothetical protein n=1 Tax=unclassified Caulobacter TaxID=2648921 RepID=UPI000D731173|nr:MULTISPECIES: hypothetical protein [unclassified Caulobacter]PXA92529.1 hypothetical protein DMC25_04750 [Caulobacter sp. D4A]PXA96297.1 hypothetical protein DMC18_01910 [Caulobacter sp. D5]